MPSRVVKTLTLAGLTALALAACDRKADAPAKPAQPAPAVTPSPSPAAPAALAVPDGFQHDGSFDAQGFYLPVAPIKIGTLALRHIAFGAPSDFKGWEAGAKESVFGPIMLYFVNETSPTNTNELGQEVHAVGIRVLPTAYRVFPGGVSFRATDPKLGEIGFVGAIDPKAVAEAQAMGPGENRIALKGTLRVGAATFEDARFTFFMGD